MNEERVAVKKHCTTKITVNVNSHNNSQPVIAGMIIFIGPNADTSKICL